MPARYPESDSEDFDDEELEEELELGFDQLQARNRDEDCDEQSTEPLSTGLAKTYVHLWRGAHAFREYYQNWADAIKETNNLGEQGFGTKLEDKKKIWLFKALHPSSGKLLGFIRFTKTTGTIGLTNFEAELSRKTLDLGYTSKRRNANLAGCHGEGYKLASLVMVREGYRVKIATSSRHWSFRFGGRGKRHLWCYFSKTTEKSQQRVDMQKNAYAARIAKGKSRDTKANIWEDVTITIGGGGKKARIVSQNDFLEWIQHCIDLDPPASVIKTKLGDLILDPKFANKMYLKGLLLPGNTKSRKWKFGYNLAQGDVNRDRQQFSDPEEQGEVITGIWDEACQKDNATTVVPYLDMLRAETQYPDVAYAEDNMSETMAKRIWELLLQEDPERKLFYYYGENGDQEFELIKKSLKKEPKSLQRAIWNPLRKFKLVLTAEEQRHHLLHNAPQSAAPSTPYSKGFNRALKAVLSLDPRTKDLEVEFRSGADAELDLLLQGSTLLVNDRWLDFHSSHQVAVCSLFTEATASNLAIDCFSCGHIVSDLYELLLVELSKSLAGDERFETSSSSLRLRVSESIEQMPCKVAVMTGGQAQELIVSWVHSESQKADRLHGLDLKGCVTLHRTSTCKDMKSELLSSELPEDDGPMQDVEPHLNNQCGCPEKFVSLKDSCVIFHDLDHTQEYFPMVSRTIPQSFFGLPPPAVSPKELQIIRPIFISSATQQPSLSVRVTPRKDQSSSFSSSSAYDVSGHDDDDGDNERMEIDTPIGHPSSQWPNTGSESVSALERSPVRPASIPANFLTSDSASLEVRSLKKEIEDLRKQLDDQQSRLLDYVAEVEDLQEQLAVKEEKLQNVKSELRTLGRDLRAASKVADQLQAATSELHKLQQDLRAAKKEISEKAKQFIELNAQITALTTKYITPLKDRNAKEQQIVQEQDKNRNQQHLLRSTEDKLQKATAEIPRWTKQLEEAAAQQTKMKGRLKTLEQDIQAKEAALELAKSSIKTLEMSEQDADLTIETLRENIQLLQNTNAEVEADLDTQREINATQTRMAERRIARLKEPVVGVKREIKEEDVAASGLLPKRPRRANVITTQVEGPIVID